MTFDTIHVEGRDPIVMRTRLHPDDGPSPGDMVVILAGDVIWMDRADFALWFEEIPDDGDRP